MFETLEEQKAETARQEKAEAAKSHSWPVFLHPAALSNEQLRCLSDKARELGRPLTDEERAFLLGLVLDCFITRPAAKALLLL